MSLKAAQIPAFKPADTPYRKFDGRGLYLEVRPNGSKLWYFKYRFLSSEKRRSFGTFPEVSLAQARLRCDDDGHDGDDGRGGCGGGRPGGPGCARKD